jgi:hypothetical protein
MIDMNLNNNRTHRNNNRIATKLISAFYLNIKLTLVQEMDRSGIEMMQYCMWLRKTPRYNKNSERWLSKTPTTACKDHEDQFLSLL